MTGKRTKEIIETISSGKKRKPLYSQGVLESLQHEFESWIKTSVREEDRKNWLVSPQTVLGSDIARKMIYTPLDTPDLDYMEDLGFSGQEPFTR